MKITIDPNAPIEIHKIKGKDVNVIREDLRPQPPLPPHGKMGVLDQLCKYAKLRGYELIGCFGSKHSNWITGLPYLAEKYGLKSIVCFPAKDASGLPSWLLSDITKLTPQNHTIHLLKPNITSINSIQAQRYIEDQKGFFIPFGFEHPITIEYLSSHILLPTYIGTLIASCGSGITLASVLSNADFMVSKIIAVSSGRSIKAIEKTIKKYVKVDWHIQYVDDYGYNDVPNIECKWNAHDHFELKAYDWMFHNIKSLPEPIYFLNIGGNS